MKNKPDVKPLGNHSMLLAKQPAAQQVKPKKPNTGAQIGVAASPLAGYAGGQLISHGIHSIFGPSTASAAGGHAASTAAGATSANAAYNGAVAGSDIGLPAGSSVPGISGGMGGGTGLLSDAGATADVGSGGFSGVSGSIGANTVGTTGSGLLGTTGATPTLLGSSTAGAFLPAAGYAAGAETGYLQGKGALDIVQNKKPGLLESAALFPFDGGATLAANVFGLPFGHSPRYYEGKDRNSLLDNWHKNGVIGDDNVLQFGDAAPLTLGAEHGGMLANLNPQGNGPLHRHYYDVDFSNPAAGQTTADLNPLGFYLGQHGGKLNSDVTGMLVNEALNGGDPTQNALDAYRKAGLTHDAIYGQIDLADKAGKLDHKTADAYKNGLDQLFHVGAYAPGGSASHAAQSSLPQAPVSAPISSNGMQTLPYHPPAGSHIDLSGITGIKPITPKDPNVKPSTPKTSGRGLLSPLVR